MKRLLLLTLALTACRDPATLVGTAVLVSVDSAEVRVDQLRYEATVDGGLVFDPVLRPAQPGGPVLGPTTTVRILLNDALAGQQLEVDVFGLESGADVAVGHGHVQIERGFERLLAVTLGASQCEGCVTAQGRCQTVRSVGACGASGGVCVSCDPLLADACVNGACACGSAPACSQALGADRCEGGQCKCGSSAACGAGQECLAQTCQCTPASCPGGCCLGNQCVTTQSPTTCGMGGRACADCGATACNGGQCVTSSCNATTCPTGCCIGATCVIAPTDFACGRSGAACESCGSGTCDGGACSGGCSAATCPNGCCLGGVCQAGTSQTACGSGGATCSACTTSCSNKQCVDPCGPSNCTGCCSSGVCRSGTSSTACGVGGQSCASCGAGSSCSADGGVCITTSSCNASTCPNGCCDGTTCRSSTATTCGTAGRSCTSCVTTRSNSCDPSGQCGCGSGSVCDVGLRCVGGTCTCDPATCAGCCDGTTCRSGTQKSKCGRDGGVCMSCSGSCTAGACQ